MSIYIAGIELQDENLKKKETHTTKGQQETARYLEFLMFYSIACCATLTQRPRRHNKIVGDILTPLFERSSTNEKFTQKFAYKTQSTQYT